MSMQAKCTQIFPDVLSESYKKLAAQHWRCTDKQNFTAYGLDCFKSGGKLFQNALIELSAYCSDEYLTPDSLYEMSRASALIASC